MQPIKLSDATHDRPWLWSWYGQNVRIDFEHRGPKLTIATINSHLIWCHTARINPSEAWTELSLAMLGHGILFDITPQEYPSVTLPEMDGP